MPPARPDLSSRQCIEEPLLPSHPSARTLVFESPAPKEIGKSPRRKSGSAGPAVPSNVGLSSTARFHEVARDIEAHRFKPRKLDFSSRQSPPSPPSPGLARVIRRRFENADVQLVSSDPFVTDNIHNEHDENSDVVSRSEHSRNERFLWLSNTFTDLDDKDNDTIVPPGWTDSDDEPEPLAPGEAPRCCNCNVELPITTELFQCRDGRRRWFCRSCPSPYKPHRRRHRISHIGISPRVLPQRC